jgi:hypothetical protein
VLEDQPYRFPDNTGLAVRSGGTQTLIMPKARLNLRKGIPVSRETRLSTDPKKSRFLSNDKVMVTFESPKPEDSSKPVQKILTMEEARKLGINVSHDGSIRVNREEDGDIFLII